MYYLVVTFSITYLKVQVHANTSAILWWLLVAHTVHFAAIPLVGRLSDRYGRRPVYLVGAISVGLVFHAMMYAGQPAIMAEMFPTRMRYSGVSLGYQVTAIVAGSLAPIIAVRLLEIYDSSVPIAVYLAAACAVTAIAVLFARETKGIDLATVDRADAEELAAAESNKALA